MPQIPFSSCLTIRRLSFIVLTILLLISPACNSKVVVGRAASVTPVLPEKVKEKKAETKPEAKPSPTVEAKAEEKAKEEKPASPKPEAQADEAAKPKVAAEASPAPVEAKADVTAKSSPAKPRPAAAAEEKPGKVEAPYALDLSFGGFGLGQGLFDTPVSVAVDDQENIYVVDQGNYRVQKFDRFGIFQFTWGRQGMGDGEFTEENVAGNLFLKMTGEFEFNKPVGILLDEDTVRSLIRITVVDSLNYRIQRFLLTRNQGDLFPDNPLDANDPTNVFLKLKKLGDVEADTELKDKYQAESRQVILDPIYIKKANNILLAPFLWGGLGFAEGKLNLPTYVTIDDSGILYVSDTENGRVQGFYVTPNNPGTDGTFFRQWGNDMSLPYGAGRLTHPTAIAFDNSAYGGFLVLDRLENGTYNIQRFDREGRFLNVFAVSGDKEGQFREPVAIAVNPFDNTVFVTDRAHKKIMVYNNKGEFMYEFGGEELADPRGLTVLRNNYVYVTDAAKNMVYRYLPQ